MEHRFHLVRISSNRKLGGIPASTTSRSSCPDNCSYKGNGCYGEGGPISLHWRALDEGRRGDDLKTFCSKVKQLPKFQLWRHNQVGDLPGKDGVLDAQQVGQIVAANRGKKGFTFTHYDPTNPVNAEVIRSANRQGLTVNLSAETLAQADHFMSLGIGPVVMALPADAKRNRITPAGHTVKVCPATVSDTTCALCAICADPDRKTIVGFPAHGNGAKKVEKVFFANN